ncbi:TPA: heavy metal-binding domain-containing protein, partial [Legionella pneumophila]|nr:heavy metal-binding domain-containing protein [Legionella pneumophila]HAU3920991.1 heavy metal-binding domain-containing protein [Legionella pneumophila]
MTMMITTGNSFDGKVIKQCLGIVRGIVVRSPTISQ